MAENEEVLKSFLMKVKKESEKASLKLSVQRTRSWHLVPSLHGKLNGDTMKTARDFNLGGSKITADGDCSHEMKRRLLLGRIMYGCDC